MKKQKKIIILVFLFAIIGNIISLPTYAISELCNKDHFDKLHTTGSNETQIIRTPPSENTCPYVAMSLLLTFYDSYWNDDFVADEYEWEPGTYNRTTDTLTETFAPTIEAAAWETHIATLNLPSNADTYPYYRAYAAANEGNYLEPYLISIGKSLLFHLDPNETLGLNDLETVAVLQAYLYIYRGFNVNQITVNYLHEDDGDIEAKMREVIGNGFPLIYIGKKLDSTTTTNTDNEGQTKSGHELIAYGIDGDNNIMLHTGWSTNEFCTYEGGSNPTEYNLNRAIIWFELKGDFLTHTHTENSGNYVDSLTGETLCACQIYSTHPGHSSNHISLTNDSVFYNNTYHWNNACHCKQPGPNSVVNLHDFNYVCIDNSGTRHLEDCVGCGYARYADHEYTIPNSPVEGGHSLKCICGATSSITEAHSESKYVISNGVRHFVYCNCGYYFGPEEHRMTTVGTRSECADCGYVGSSGIVPPYFDKIYKITEDEIKE